MALQEITIDSPDGAIPAGLVTPSAGGGRSGIVLYMDIFGPRPALYGMAERYAAEGYTVLVPDLFFRYGDYGPFDPATAFDDPTTKQKMMAMAQATTQAVTAADTAHFLGALDAAGVTGPVGTVGYCLGGARALTAAAEYPDRIAAAASLHGGGLASDAPDSPHLRAAEIRGRVYVGSAGVDRGFTPEQAARFAQALREAEVDYTMENYVGMAHGWCVPDHGVYDSAGSERHWKRVLELFSETLV